MQLISKHRTGSEIINRNNLISAALVHDMGNIVKFTFSEDTMSLLEWVEDLTLLKKIQQDMHQKYWQDDHQANLSICKELGIHSNIINIVDAVDFNNIIEHSFSSHPYQILITYTDLRVAPFSVVSVKERLDESAKRYGRKDRAEHAECSMQFANNHEKDIFKNCSIEPEDINDETVNPLIEDLRKFKISTNKKTLLY